MKVSEYIKKLEALREEHGDLEVYQYAAGGLRTATLPNAENLRILSKRESRMDFWNEWRSTCTPENKGEKVISL